MSDFLRLSPRKDKDFFKQAKLIKVPGSKVFFRSGQEFKIGLNLVENQSIAQKNKKKRKIKTILKRIDLPSLLDCHEKSEIFLIIFDSEKLLDYLNNNIDLSGNKNIK